MGDFHEFAQELIRQSGITLNSFIDELEDFTAPLYTVSKDNKKMNPAALFNAVIEIMRLSQHMVQLIHSGGDDEVIVHAIMPYFEQIQNICNAAKPEIQGYSEHE